MATTAQAALADQSEAPHWFSKFLRSELAPYPGRAAAVARITLAVVVTLILVMTFRIPVIPMTLYMVFLISRETPSAAVKSTVVSILAIAAGIATLLAGMVLFADYPPMNFLFLNGIFFVLFFLVRVMAQRTAATNMGLAIYSGTVLWSSPFPAELHVERTAWVLGSLSLGLGVALIVELIFVRHGPAEEILTGLDQRLSAVEKLLLSYAELGADAANTSAAREIVTLATVGTGRLRRQMRSAENGYAKLRQYYAELHTVIALVGRLVDVSATLQVRGELTWREQERLRRLAVEIGRMRRNIDEAQRPDPVDYPVSREPSPEIPLLPELERAASFIPQAFSPAESAAINVVAPIDEVPRTRVFVADAFSNPEHIRFAVKGCLATTICYIIYTAIAWPGISTCVITCLVTALSTLGASHQRLTLRLAGATLGGLVLGIGSVALVMPDMQSITPIALLVGAVSALGAWFATSSPRLSYFGLQTCLAFYLTAFQGFTNSTSLKPAWDHFVGVLLGLGVMWLVFEHLWPERAAEGMLRGFASNLRLLAQLATVIESGDREHAIRTARRLRELINAGFAEVHSHADTVVFEFGPLRKSHVALREHILRWQAYARTLFLVEIAITQYRIQIDYSAIPRSVIEAKTRFDTIVSGALRSIADQIDGVTSAPYVPDLRPALEQLEAKLTEWYEGLPQGKLSARTHGILTLSEQLVTILENMARDVEGGGRDELTAEADYVLEN
jgi:multidrug resistance protein MdtO